jgi:hypothetical protein
MDQAARTVGRSIEGVDVQAGFRHAVGILHSDHNRNRRRDRRSRATGDRSLPIKFVTAKEKCIWYHISAYDAIDSVVFFILK